MSRKYKRIYCCGDCINYDWKKHRCRLGANKETNAQDHFYDDCPLPTYDEEERPHGKWIKRHYINGNDWNKSFDMYVCSNCGEEFSYDAETGISINNYNTCPNCTADMKENKD